MIYLNQNSINTVILELTSVSSLLTPFYTFKFTNDINGVEIVFNAADLSTYKSRYNRFEITESGTTYINLTAGTVNLLSGSYTYDIFEASASTLTITTDSISTGKAIVNGSDSDLADIYK